MKADICLTKDNTLIIFPESNAEQLALENFSKHVEGLSKEEYEEGPGFELTLSESENIKKEPQESIAPYLVEIPEHIKAIELDSSPPKESFPDTKTPEPKETKKELTFSDARKAAMHLVSENDQYKPLIQKALKKEGYTSFAQLEAAPQEILLQVMETILEADFHD